jgi:hypothetical protein
MLILISSTCFEPEGSSSGRRFLYHIAALVFLPRLFYALTLVHLFCLMDSSEFIFFLHRAF